MSKMVAQVFLKSRHELTLVLSREVADAAQAALNHEAKGVLSGVTLDGVSYSVRLDEVGALLVQTHDHLMQKLQQQALQQTAPPQVPQKPSPFGTIQFPGPRA